MKSLYLLTRHLPTVDDADNLFSDPDAESPLLKIDYERLAAVTATLDALRQQRASPLAVLSSPLRRSSHTAMLLSDRLPHESCAVDSRLCNIRHPEWNGLEQGSVRDTDLYKSWHSAPASVSFPGGETLGEVAARVDSFLLELPRGHDYLIVSHSTPLQVLACRLLGIPIDAIWSFYFESYAVTAIVGGALTRFNDVAGRTCDYDALYE